MARWCIKNVALRGVSGTVPDNKVDSHDFDFFTHEEAETFINTVGIRERYVATDDLCASDLCYDAAVRLLDALGWERESIDVLIFESVTGDYRTPPTAGILQDRLGLPSSTFVLDVCDKRCGQPAAVWICEAGSAFDWRHCYADGVSDGQESCAAVRGLRYSYGS